MPSPLLERTDRGLYCAAGDFYVDPWRPVHRAVVTHAHADHMTPGSAAYLGAEPALGLMRLRLGPDAVIETLPYGQTVSLGGVRLSLHPAGHVLGSAQVRLAYRGEVWVVTGDFKTAPDPTCAPFEPLRAHVLVTESTFGLPIYRWPDEADELAALHAWWRQAAEAGRVAVVFGYALGKAQRLLARLDPHVGPIYTHGAVERVAAVYRAAGVAQAPTTAVAEAAGRLGPGALVLAPPSAHGSPWMRRFGEAATAFCSGWMRLRGPRRRRAVERGFVISDHADWDGLTAAVLASGAERVLPTHGYTDVLARWCREQGLDAEPLATTYVGERDEAREPDEEPEQGARSEQGTNRTGP